MESRRARQSHREWALRADSVMPRLTPSPGGGLPSDLPATGQCASAEQSGLAAASIRRAAPVGIS